MAKNGSGINSIADLKGKKVAMPFNSTTHFHLMVALEQAKVNPADVQVLNMRPPEVGKAKANDYDAAESNGFSHAAERSRERALLRLKMALQFLSSGRREVLPVLWQRKLRLSLAW